MEYYRNQKTYGLEKYFIDLDEWVAKDIEDPKDNVPLVIEADEGAGKKTLLV